MNWTAAVISAALTVALAGCDEKKAPEVAPVQAQKAPAVAEAPTPAAPTGPDGPADLFAPKIEISTAPEDIARGKDTFAAKGCVACHKVGGGKLVGPDLKDVLVRRTQPWVEKMILNPEAMVARDDAAKAMFRTFLVPMANQKVDPVAELPFILSFLKSESKGPAPEARN